MTTAIKRTYSARSKSTASSSSLSRVPPKRWRNDDGADAENAPPTPQKRRRLSSSDPKMKLLPTTSTCNGKQPQQKTLTQLHFVLESSVLRTCSLCGLSYTKGAPDDEVLHRSHCGRVQRGMEWGREEEKESFRAGVTEVATNVTLKNGSRGRIICFPANIGGRIGSKVCPCAGSIGLFDS
ncbi:hypothetical protein ID866_4211 [Astraeus odoratus]|nr:hypothetical protein ID866_4211 [Astraeus odoratus]